MRKLALFFAIAFLATAALAQDRPALTAQPNSVYVGADGKFEADPDTAVLSFSINPQEDTAKAAYDKASKAAEQVRQILRTNGIDPKAAEMGFLSVQPMYDYRKPTQKLIGYRVSTTITVKLKQKDFDKIGPLTQQLAEIDTAAGQNLAYDLTDMEAAKKKAVEDAFAKARSSASTLAVAGGRSLAELIYAAVDVNEPVRIMMAPRAQMMKMSAEAAPAPTEGFAAQRITVTAHVNALFGMK
ncbi:MAG: SIMPL domain-containing protein [Candidatus Koribacter versatilis]|uniref:SIMPL domain-containing protein n=1 Tax=Candidatus Korobacter versatilis TaxID=658062 RepID=A0A932A8R4_9BACT|nr:SIMPL domain-containing protein [Candidatus Koribacter versatilis]